MQLNFKGAFPNYRISTRLPFKSRFSMLSLLKAILGFFWILWILLMCVSKARVAIPLISQIFFVFVRNCFAAMSTQGHWWAARAASRFQGRISVASSFSPISLYPAQDTGGITRIKRPGLHTGVYFYSKVDLKLELSNATVCWRATSAAKRL